MKNQGLRIKFCQAAWVFCLLSFAMPFSRISINGETFSQFLLTNYAGMVAFGVLVLLAAIQWGVYFKKKKWLSWPGIVAGLYGLALTLNLARQIFPGFDNEDPNSLVKVMKVSAQAGPGLFLLGTTAGTLFVIGLLQMISNKNNRSFISPMNT